MSIEDRAPTPEREFADPLASARDVPTAEPDDAFAAAAQALNFGSGPVTTSREAASAAPRREQRRQAHREQRRLTTPFRRFAAATASVAAVGAITLVTVGTALPPAPHPVVEAAPADAATTDDARAKQVDEHELAATELQGYVAGTDIEAAPLQRVDGYEASTFTDVAQASGINTAGAFFHNDPTADIQWPFAVGTSMSSPFGYRWGRLHEGVDFTPGAGAPIQAIADGVVRTATEAGGAYGVNVYIDHVIDGELVTSHYAHMEYGSLQVVSGQRVEVGDVLGRTGNTGRSYGAHTHFEIRYNGTAIDPLPWLNEHANRHYTKEERAQVQRQETALLGQDFTE